MNTLRSLRHFHPGRYPWSHRKLQL